MSGDNSYGAGLHNWNPDGSDTTSGKGDIPASGFHKPNTYGFLLVPATAGKQGNAIWYFNGKAVKTITFGQSGLFSTLNNQSVTVLLGTGPNNPMTVYEAGVWTVPDSSFKATADQVVGPDCGRPSLPFDIRAIQGDIVEYTAQADDATSENDRLQAEIKAALAQQQPTKAGGGSKVQPNALSKDTAEATMPAPSTAPAVTSCAQ